MKRKGLPERNEMVICRIVQINPNSVFAELLEYEASGMIHVSEVASRWVRDIKEFIKEKQYVVCRVLSADQSGVSLSIKRVHPKEAERQLNRFKKETNAEKILEMAAKSIGRPIDQAHAEAGLPLLEAFGSLNKAFEIAVKDPEVLKPHLQKDWYEAVVSVAQKRMVEKTYEVRAELRLTSYEPDGLERIKEALSLAGNGMEVAYVSAPRYIISAKGTNYKDVRRRVEEAAEKVTKSLKGEASFRVLE